MKRKPSTIVISLLLVCIMLLSACAKQTDQSAAQTSAANAAASPEAKADAKTEEKAPTESTETIRIGSLWPYSGGTATIGKQYSDGLDLAIEQINANGGVKSLNGAKIELIKADTESKPDKGVTQAERLMSKENICMLIGAYSSAVTFPITDVAERNQVPLIVGGAAKTDITEKGYKYTFRVNPAGVQGIKDECYPAYQYFNENFEFGVKRIGLVYDSSDWGADVAKQCKDYAAEFGFEIVLDEPITTGTPDMNPTMLKIKNANPDVVLLALYTPEQILFSKAYEANKINIKAGLFTFGAGGEDPAFYEAVPASAWNYMMVQADMDAYARNTKPFNIELAKICEEKYGYPFNIYFAQGYIFGYTAYHALETGATTDPVKLRDALAALDLSIDEVKITGFAGVKFDEKGQNMLARGVISQYQDGKEVVIFPDDVKEPDSKPLLPPNWEDR